MKRYLWPHFYLKKDNKMIDFHPVHKAHYIMGRNLLFQGFMRVRRANKRRPWGIIWK